MIKPAFSTAPAASTPPARACSPYYPQLYPAGPFGAVLAPSLWVRQTGVIPPGLHAALLDKLPDADGLNGSALPELIRGPIRLSDHNQWHLAVAHPLLLKTTSGARVKGLALVDADGRPLFAGTLRGRGLSPSPCVTFNFPSHCILLRRPAIVPARVVG